MSSGRRAGARALTKTVFEAVKGMCKAARKGIKDPARLVRRASSIGTPAALRAAAGYAAAVLFGVATGILIGRLSLVRGTVSPGGRDVSGSGGEAAELDYVTGMQTPAEPEEGDVGHRSPAPIPESGRPQLSAEPITGTSLDAPLPGVTAEEETERRVLARLGEDP